MEKPRPELDQQPEFKPAVDVKELMEARKTEVEVTPEGHRHNAEQLFTEALALQEADSLVSPVYRGEMAELGVRLGRFKDVKRILENHQVYVGFDVHEFVVLAVDRGAIDLAEFALGQVEEREQIKPDSPSDDMDRAGKFRAHCRLAWAKGETAVFERNLAEVEADKPGATGERTTQFFAELAVERGEFDRAWRLSTLADKPATTVWVIEQALKQGQTEWAKEATLSIKDEYYRALAQTEIAVQTRNPEDIEVAHQDIELINQEKFGGDALGALGRLAQSGDESAMPEALERARAIKGRDQRLQALAEVYEVASDPEATELLEEMWDQARSPLSGFNRRGFNRQDNIEWVLKQAINKGDTAFVWNAIDGSNFSSNHLRVALRLAEKGHPHAIEGLKLVAKAQSSEINTFNEREANYLKILNYLKALSGSGGPNIGADTDLIDMVKIICRYEGLEAARELAAAAPSIPGPYRLYAAMAEVELEGTGIS